MHSDVYCGATIIDRNWVITAAHCLVSSSPGRAFVEVGDYARTMGTTYLHRVQTWFLAEGFQLTNRPIKDIGLIKLRSNISAHRRPLPLCEEIGRQGTMIGICGMGSTSTRSLLTGSIFPVTLLEAYFTETFLDDEYFVPFVHQPTYCREDNICTDRLTTGANCCVMDDGSPAYQMRCDFEDGIEILRPSCLYGVVSYYPYNRSTFPAICNKGTYLASVPHVLNWIRTTMALN
ncbi:chymotrypsin-1-like [Convolutriloba macropyga]|uniref:chymotrypsin-1-like n=1 Tax=Convolutriloba macropyga TaxID=536237 RepID=UPI003F524115